MRIEMGLLNYIQSEDAFMALATSIKTRDINRVLIITGQAAWEASRERLEAAFVNEGIGYIPIFTGDQYPSWAKTRHLLEAMPAGDIGGILGLGGGRAMDMAKMTAERAAMPVFLAPTQAAQCASTAPLAAVYNEDGTRAPDVITRNPILGTFVDMQVVSHAPCRLLASGIADAFAKMAETYSAVMLGGRNSPRWGAAVALSREASDIFFRESAGAMAGERDALDAAVYAALYLTGMLSAMGSDRASPSLAHNLYAAACDLYPGPRKALHGEIVGVGVLLTAMVCDIPGMEAGALRTLMAETLHVPVTWGALGYPTDEAAFEKVLTFITQRKQPLPDMALADVRMALKELFI